MSIDRVLTYLSSEPWLISSSLSETIMATINAKLSGEPLVKTDLDLKPNVQSPWRKGSVAVLPIHGPIFRYSRNLTMLCGEHGVSTEMLTKQLDELLKDPSIKSIVLDLNSPGGHANGIHELAERIFEARSHKRIVSYVGGYACSAGYWLASAASEIYIDKIAHIGSIGAVVSFRRSKSNETLFETVEIKSSQSPKKNLDPASKEGRIEMEATLDALAEVFIESVARNRGVSVATVKSDFGQGGVFVGKKALDAKMADGFRHLHGLLDELNRSKNTSLLTHKSITSKGYKMDLEELKNDHSEIYTAVFEEGKNAANVSQENAVNAALKAERERVQSIANLSKPGFEANILSFIQDPECSVSKAAEELWHSVQPSATAENSNKGSALVEALADAEAATEVPATQTSTGAVKAKKFSTPAELYQAALTAVKAGQYADVKQAIQALNEGVETK